MPGSVTIATNMAGRGTDIQLGGNLDMRLAKWRAGAGGAGHRDRRPRPRPKKRDAIEAEIESKRAKALAAGGLFVLGTERHESRRIDNQLRGRTGRQGDPGHSKFFLSCEDDLLRIFAGDRLDAIMRTFGVAGRRGDHPPVAEQRHRHRPEAGRAAQLRDPQEPPEVRRRGQRPAQGGVRAAPGVHGGRATCRRSSPRCATTPSTTWSPATCRPRPTPTSGTSRA